MYLQAKEGYSRARSTESLSGVQVGSGVPRDVHQFGSVFLGVHHFLVVSHFCLRENSLGFCFRCHREIYFYEWRFVVVSCFCLNDREGDILVPGFRRDYSAQWRMWTTEANIFWDKPKQHSFWVGQVLIWAFIFGQEGGPNARYLCTFPVRGELACRECSDHWNSEERASFAGLLIEANRITRGTISNQRQLNQLTPEITRSQKVNVRILLTETKTTHHHQNPAFEPHPVQGTPTHPKR